MNICKQKLKAIYHDNRFDQYTIIKLSVKCIRKLSQIIKEFKAFINLIILKLKCNKKNLKNSGKINIVFLYQMPELWNKIESVCKEFINDKKFNVTILAIPKADINNTGVESGIDKYLDNEALEASKNFNCKVIDARVNKIEWYDLKSLNPDYIFYQRPYDQYLPDIYASYNTIKYTKACYVPYGWITTTNLQEICFNREFFRNLYLFYAENVENAKIIKKRTFVSHLLNLRKTLSLGYPSLDLVNKLKGSASTSWIRDRKLDGLRIIWTPRWTMDKHLCASNFFEYKDKFIEFAKNSEDVYVLFRPHPLAFENYLKVGLMSQDEIDGYKNNVNQLQNASIDSQKDYLTTFWDSDVLVTDMSSIIVEYFLTGKPIIYCDNGTAPLDKFTTEMSQGFYWARSWNDIESTIIELKNGKDRLYDKRQELIKELFGDNTIDSSIRIVESILKDYKG